MTPGQKEDCNIIIHGASVTAAAIGGGMAQLPCADTALLIPLQITMVIGIGKAFGKHVTDTVAKGMVMGVAAGYTGRAVSQVLLGWIPFLGNAVNASTAAGITEFVGWQMADRFDKEQQAKAKPNSKDKQDASPTQAVGSV